MPASDCPEHGIITTVLFAATAPEVRFARISPKKRRPGPRGTGPFQCALLVTGGDSNRAPFTAELPKQLRIPQESHLRKLLTAAHTYSQNWSRITSISDDPEQCARRVVASPSRRGCDSRVTWDTGLSMALYCPPPGSSSRKRLPGTLAGTRPDPDLRVSPSTPVLSHTRGVPIIRTVSREDRSFR
jgi:hypothetical protein